MSASTDGRAAWVAGLAMLALVLFNPAVLNDGDTYSHIATGNWMIAHHAVLHSDPFSATHAGAAWVAHEWLSEIMLAVAWRLGGWSGVVALTAIAAAATFYQLGRHLARWLPAGGVLVLLVLAASCVAPGMLARPHVLAMPVFEAWVAGLLIARADGRADGRAPPWRLLWLMWLWANLHGGFIIGLALVVPLGAEAVLAAPDRAREVALRWAAFLAAGFGVALLTPHGAQGVLLAFRMSSMAALSQVSEWQPASFATLQPLELLILIGLYMGLGRGARLPPLRLLVVLGLLHMALQHARHLALIGLIVPLLIAEPMGAALPPGRARRTAWLGAAGLAAAGLLLALRFAVPVRPTDGPTAPIAALAHVPPAMRATPVLNDYAFGGYLIFAGVRPSIDARAELYGADGLAAYAALVRPDRAALDAALDGGRVAWTIFSPANPVTAEMDALPGWCRIYADAMAVVHARGCGR